MVIATVKQEIKKLVIVINVILSIMKPPPAQGGSLNLSTITTMQRTPSRNYLLYLLQVFPTEILSVLDTIADNVDIALLNVSHSEHKTLATLYLLPPRSKFQATVKQMIHRVWRFQTATVQHCHFQHANFLYSSDVDGLIVLKIPSRNNPTTEAVKAEARAPPKHTHDRTWLKISPRNQYTP